MNFLQYLLFVVYACATLCAGIVFYRQLNPNKTGRISRAVYAGEVYLLGSIIIVGSFLMLSVLGLYRGPFLLGVVIAFALLLFRRSIRKEFICLVQIDFRCIPSIIFLILTLWFIFRNAYFLVDVDSHSSYLFAQKIWLEHATSIIRDTGLDMRTYTPHFNAVPYALGISFFGIETLFAQQVVMSWTVVSMLLLFGYTGYVLNKWYGLAAVFFFICNDHMFLSGANQCCIINSALIAFIFAAVYNFWESRNDPEVFRFGLGLIFASQLMANKYQMVYTTLFMVAAGILIQRDMFRKLNKLFRSKPLLIGVLGAALVTALWFLKNWLATGVPTFPILAGHFDALNWTAERQHAFMKGGSGELTITAFIKYFSYFFVWPGVNPAKFILLMIIALPFLGFIRMCRRIEPSDNEAFAAVNFWLLMSIVCLMGICLTNYTDPRVYRYNMAVFAFCAVIGLDYFLKSAVFIKPRFARILLIILLSLSGYQWLFYQGGNYKASTIKENFAVISGQLHFTDIMDKYYPESAVVRKEFSDHPEKFKGAAWNMGANGFGAKGISAFLIPTMPHLDLWHTSIIRWDSYKNVSDITNDLRRYGITKVANVDEEKVVFTTIDQYAELAVEFERKPKKTFYDYGFPDELKTIQW